MKSVDIHEARTHLSRLIERVEAGEEIVIARAGRPAARLVPIESAHKPVRTGGLRIAGGVPGDFDTMFADEIEAIVSGPAERRKAPSRKCP